MKRLFLAVLVAATSTMVIAQDAPPQQQAPKVPKFQSNLVSKPQAPTFTDVNCSGFVTKEAIPDKTVVIGGEHSPHVSQFGGRDLVFLSGESMTVGQQVRFVRRVADKNRVEAFPGEYKATREAGDQ